MLTNIEKYGTLTVLDYPVIIKRRIVMKIDTNHAHVIAYDEDNNILFEGETSLDDSFLEQDEDSIVED